MLISERSKLGITPSPARIWVRTIGPGPFGGGVRAVAFTPDDRYLVTANANGTVYALRVEAPGKRSQGSTNHC